MTQPKRPLPATLSTRRKVMLGGAASGLALSVPAQIVAANAYELNLVLAFDVSASVNDEEFALQRRGTAEALRSVRIAQAISHAPGGIAVAIIQWSSIGQQAMGLDWVRLRTQADVLRYADQVAALPRRLPGGGTMIHAGLKFAEETFATAPGLSRRYVIDLSGNGRADELTALELQRDKLVSSGVVINGLAVEEDDNRLTRYFAQHLIGGPSAFVEQAASHEAFGTAMEIKLHREIAGAIFS